MVKYLVDTTVFIDHFRNKNQATEFLTKKNLAVSYIVAGELYQGVKDKRELSLIKKLINSYQINWGGEKTAIKAIKLVEKYNLKNGLGLMDALIAATALLNDLVLVSDNIKHFKMIKGLKLKRLSEV